MQCDLILLLIFLSVLNIKWTGYAGHPLDEDLLTVKPIICFNIQFYQANPSYFEFQEVSCRWGYITFDLQNNYEYSSKIKEIYD